MDDLLKKLRRGDEKAFERLVMEKQDKIYSVCMNMLKNVHDAQDAAQETFIKAYKAIRSFKGESSLDTWLTKIAVNTCLDAIRGRRDTVDIDEAYDVADPNTPEGEYEADVRRRVVRQSLARLPSELRDVIVLKDIEGCSYEEISEILNLNLGTVRSRLHRAREKIKKIFLENRELF